MGIERYHYLAQPEAFALTDQLFDCDRFCSILPGDTHEAAETVNQSSINSFRSRYPGAKYIGDKIPTLYRSFAQLEKHITGDFELIFIVRNIIDVAKSYKVRFLNADDNWEKNVEDAIDDWRQSIEAILNFNKKENVQIVFYENFFSNKPAMNKLLSSLGLKKTSETEKLMSQLMKKNAHLNNNRTEILSQADVISILTKSPLHLYRKLISSEDFKKHTSGLFSEQLLDSITSQ